MKNNSANSFVQVMIFIALTALLFALMLPLFVANANKTPKLNGTIIKKETIEKHFRGVYFENYVTIVETNRYLVPKDYFDHVSVGQYVWHE